MTILRYLLIAAMTCVSLSLLWILYVIKSAEKDTYEKTRKQAETHCRKCGRSYDLAMCIVCKKLICPVCRASAGSIGEYACVDTCLVKSLSQN